MEKCFGEARLLGPMLQSFGYPYKCSLRDGVVEFEWLDGFEELNDFGQCKRLDAHHKKSSAQGNCTHASFLMMAPLTALF